MLRVISELWVEYLTQMEALRVSVGLEAYAQRDPLVTYKARASELFQELIANTRRGVVTRMFTYRVSTLETEIADVEGVSKNGPPSANGEPGQPAAASPSPEAVGVEKPSKPKRGRRRRRRKKNNKK